MFPHETSSIFLKSHLDAAAIFYPYYFSFVLVIWQILGVVLLTAITKTDGDWLILYSKLGHNHKNKGCLDPQGITIHCI